MTGRDYKKLIKLHRDTNIKCNIEPSNENYKFFNNLIEKKTLVKYQPINYDLFKEFIKERKDAAQDSLTKVKRLEDCSKVKRNELLMKQHSVVWLKEWFKLVNQCKNVEVELEDYFRLLEKNSIVYADLSDETDDLFESNIIDELDTYRRELDSERIKFKVRTVHSVNDLREDLQYYLRTNSKYALKINKSQNEDIFNTISQVKQQQEDILDKLELDSNKLQKDLDDPIKELNKNELIVAEGIPSQAYDLDCPSEELKISVLQEFLIIDFKYSEKLKQLNENYRHLFEVSYPNKYGGWSRIEHEIFQHIYDMYHFHNINLVNCNFSLRDLMFDRMRRTFLTLDQERHLGKTRADFVKHEEWSEASKYHQQQQKLIVHEWTESRRSLLEKAEAIFAEAFEMIEKQRVKNEEKEKQLKICNQLYEKVSKWRNQKLEALEIQQKIDEMLKKQNIERLKIENEKKNYERNLQKKAINEYYERLDSLKRQQEQEEQKKLEKLTIAFSEQTQKDKERIELRNKNFMEKKAELQSKHAIKEMENEEKKARLEKFYNSVKPDVKSDPARMVSFTEAELNRRGLNLNTTLGSNTNGDLSNQESYVEKKPMYKNFSFTDKQINSDARIRIEQRLRSAGLLNSEYARSVINGMKQTSNIARRDLNANSNWKGFAFTNEST